MKKLFKVAVILIATLGLLVGCGGSKVIKPENGSASGKVGDTFGAYWFDFTVDSVTVIDDYNGYVAEEGNKLIAVTITLKSTITFEVPIFSSDFIVAWSNADEDYAYALETEDTANWELGTLDAKEKETYTWHFEVPADGETYSVEFLEFFDDDTTGDWFYISFDLAN